MDRIALYAAPLGRVLLAGLFVSSGLSKLAAYEATQGYMASVGVPGALLPLVIGFEILAPIAVIVGYRTRIAAALLAGFSIATAFVFHLDFADQIQTIMFWKNLAIAGGFFVLAGQGAGALSLDARRAS